jgi:phosphatidylserine/phosphatidylglycerophosphate/cardiolipin synthase-like enzyme
MADSYVLKSEILSLTFEENPPNDSPPLAGGDEGEREKWLSCPPPPSPSSIKGEGRGPGNSRYFWLALLFLFPLSTFYTPNALCLPAEDVQLVTDAQYFQIAKKMIQEAKQSIQVMMFEMGYYDKNPNTPSNLLIKELINARKRGVKVEVLLEVREGEDRTAKRNRHTGKILSEGGVEVIYDSLFKTAHAKCMVVDGKLTLLGSTNWTYYALTNNNEASVLIRSKEIAKAFVDYFNQVKMAGSK